MTNNLGIKNFVKNHLISSLIFNIESVGKEITHLDTKNKNCKYHMSCLDSTKVISAKAYRDLKELEKDENLWKFKNIVIDRMEKANKLLFQMMRVYYNLQEKEDKKVNLKNMVV